MVIVAQNNYGVHRAEYNINIKSVCNLLDVEVNDTNLQCRSSHRLL